MVPSTGGRSERWSAKKSLWESGFCRGCTCMSRRQAVARVRANSAAAVKTPRQQRRPRSFAPPEKRLRSGGRHLNDTSLWRPRILAWHLRDGAGVELLQKFGRGFGIVFLIGGEHDQEE